MCSDFKQFELKYETTELTKAFLVEETEKTVEEVEETDKNHFASDKIVQNDKQCAKQ